MDDLELAEAEFANLVHVCHRQGFTYWQILGILQKLCMNLYLQAEVEYKVKGGL